MRTSFMDRGLARGVLHFAAERGHDALMLGAVPPTQRYPRQGRTSSIHGFFQKCTQPDHQLRSTGGGESDDRQSPDGRIADARGALPFADRSGCFEAVHLRHLAIHEHDLERDALDHDQRFLTVAHHVDATSQSLEQPRRNLCIDEVVFGQQRTERPRLDDVWALLGCSGMTLRTRVRGAWDRDHLTVTDQSRRPIPSASTIA